MRGSLEKLELRNMLMVELMAELSKSFAWIERFYFESDSTEFDFAFITLNYLTIASTFERFSDWVFDKNQLINGNVSTFLLYISVPALCVSTLVYFLSFANFLKYK